MGNIYQGRYISGYTAFFLGIRPVVLNAAMTVRYTNTWGNYLLEKECAKELLDEGCVIISQHSDTVGAVLSGKETEKRVKGNINENDVGAGFENGWVRMLETNEFTVAEGTKERVDELIREFKQNRI